MVVVRISGHELPVGPVHVLAQSHNLLLLPEGKLLHVAMAAVHAASCPWSNRSCRLHHSSETATCRAIHHAHHMQTQEEDQEHHHQISRHDELHDYIDTMMKMCTHIKN